MTVLLVLWAVFGPVLAPRDPQERTRILRIEDGTWITAPFDPLEVEGFPLGTDFDGRDLLSRLLWAMRPTLALAIAVSATWVVVGLLVGIAIEWAPGWISRPLRRGMQAAVSAPLLIVAIWGLYLLEGSRGTLHFVAALTITGWSTAAELVAVHARSVRHAPYADAARALGASEIHIMRRHLAPHLVTVMPVLAPLQVAAALLILAELGFLGFFVGGGDVRSIADAASTGSFEFIIPGAPELGGMIGAGWDNFFKTPWLAVWAGGAFFVTILTFTMLGEGMRQRLAER